MSTDRNHLYLYTVSVRRTAEETGNKGVIHNVTYWDKTQIDAFNIVQAAHKLGREINEVRYVHKVILQ